MQLLVNKKVKPIQLAASTTYLDHVLGTQGFNGETKEEQQVIIAM
jgi:hypothetical protein